MGREIIIDTETTGGSAAQGDRCIEIGAVEMIDGEKTGRTFHTFVNPHRKSSRFAIKAHGIKDEFLLDKPDFKDIAPDLLDFIGDSVCVAHGARFDRDMLISDFHHAGLGIPNIRFVDSLAFMKRTVSIPKHGLDAVAMHLGVTDKVRGDHSALEDAQILADCLVAIDAKTPGAFRKYLEAGNLLALLPRHLAGEDAQTKVVQASIEAARKMVTTILDVANTSSNALEMAQGIRAQGIYVRTAFQRGGDSLLGFRFSTREATFTSSMIGLSGASLPGMGIEYRKGAHYKGLRDLAHEHESDLGPLEGLAGKIDDKYALTDRNPTDSGGRKPTDEVCQIIREVMSSSKSIWDAVDRLEAKNIKVKTSLDVKAERVRKASFLYRGRRISMATACVDTMDFPENFWNFFGHQKPYVPKSYKKRMEEISSTQFKLGEGLGDGVPDIVADLNNTVGEMGFDTVIRARCGRDLWSSLKKDDLLDVLRAEPEFAPKDVVLEAIEGESEQDQAKMLRWMCRGLAPDRARALHEGQVAYYALPQEERAALREKSEEAPAGP